MGGGKVFQSTCPCCGARLLVDEKTRKVVSHTSVEEEPRSVDERFTDKLDKVKRAKAEQTKLFDEAQKKERSRKDRLASLFDEATQKVKEEGPVEKPPERFWD